MTAGCSKPTSDQAKEQASVTPAPTATILRDGVTLTADPNPIIVDGTPKLGKTTVSWKTPVKFVELRIGAPGGTLFSRDGGNSKAVTDKWVTDGMTFYLQDGTAPKPTDPSATLATLKVAVR